jgi:DNA-binding GntR family transcriptional regulator
MTLATPANAISETFPQPRRVSLAESIADSIAEAIATRHLNPGERLVETALADRLGVSRVPIREALKVLHAQGILSGGGHRGYRVSSFEPDTIQKVFEVRLMLETFLLRDAIRNWAAGLEDPGELDPPIQQMRMSAKAGDGRASLRADLEFHRVICRAARNEIAATLWEAIARHVLIIFNLDRYRDNDLAAVARQHVAFRDFVLAQTKAPGPEDELRRALEDHLLQVARTKARAS